MASKKSGRGETLPLSGKRILITRARGQAKELSQLLEDYGAKVIIFPTIEIVPPEDPRPLDKAIERLDIYEWVIFTSVNGVRYFTRRMKEKGKSMEALAGKKICVIGPRTQRELEQMGLKVSFIPREYRAEGVAEGLRAKAVEGKRILLPRAKGARRILPRALREAGAVVDEVEVYKTNRPSDGRDTLGEILRKGIDVVVFTSSSTVRNFMEILSKRKLMDGVKIAVIGPVTAETARGYGLVPSITASEYTIAGLVEAIIKYFKGTLKK